MQSGAVEGREESSFRDPSGFVFRKGDVLYRQVNRSFESHFRHLATSGLYQELSGSGALVPHETVSIDLRATDDALEIIRPDKVEFISYPYEWCFSQLKDAALLTLKIQKTALEHGMSLRDASAYNVQFVRGKPMLIDTLSFEIYDEGRPWVAYRQFCQHFLAPLALMSKVDSRLGLLQREHIDGVPLDLASNLLRARSRLSVGLAMHIHAHAKAQSRYGDREPPRSPRKMSKFALRALIDSLESTVAKLAFKPGGTEWSDYYANTNYTDQGLKDKGRIIDHMLGEVLPKPASIWDLGANIGQFSRLASKRGVETVAWDADFAAVEKCYLDLKQQPDPCLLPLVQDLANPSPAIGWANRERASLGARGPVDVVMALALIHHLAIGNNVPIEEIAQYFASLCTWLIIEFVPKEDSQVQRLLRSREDVFDRYSQAIFEEAFATKFRVVRSSSVIESSRTIYLMKSEVN